MTIDQLKAELNALPAARDVPNTPRAQEEAWEQRQTLTKRLSVARTAQENLAEVDC